MKPFQTLLHSLVEATLPKKGQLEENLHDYTECLIKLMFTISAFPLTLTTPSVTNSSFAADKLAAPNKSAMDQQKVES